MKAITKMIKEKERVYFLTMKGLLKSIIVDYFYIFTSLLIFIYESF